MNGVRAIADEHEVRALFGLMAQLRPHLDSADVFVERWRRQAADGYRLAALVEDGRAQALAGYRVQENLVYGRFLYVDDLVTDADARSSGHGARMLDWLRAEASSLDCARLVLDTPLSNALGQRFYFRCGLLATALRFNVAVER